MIEICKKKERILTQFSTVICFLRGMARDALMSFHKKNKKINDIY
jgi:hypothetical protein